MLFKNWLIENDQGIELQVAQFLESILDKAFNLLKNDNAQHPFVHYVQQVWPDSNQGFLLPNIPQVSGKPVFFIHMKGNKRATTLHDGNNFSGLQINIRNLQNDSIENIQKEIEALKSAVHHEAEHIFNKGSDLNSQDKQASLMYMNNDGEINAHAREMARIYAHNFPNEPFELNKAKSLLNLPTFNQTHKNYYDNLSQPVKWQELRDKFGLTDNPHNKIIAATQRLLQQYQK